MKRVFVVLVLVVLVAVLVSVPVWSLLNGGFEAGQVQGARVYGCSVVNVFPHDVGAFTEGLVFADGFLFESTGLYGASSLRRVNLTSGEVVQRLDLSEEYFGEGLALVNSSLVQLTYREHIAFVYDNRSFELKGNFSYASEGWGLTFNGSHLVMSDGSDRLWFVDPVSFGVVGGVVVRDGNASVRFLNELEFVGGDVYANVFMEKRIAIIDPVVGRVKGWVELAGLPGPVGGESVLNGIAYDAVGDRLFVTGKSWPSVYEVRLVG